MNGKTKEEKLIAPDNMEDFLLIKTCLSGNRESIRIRYGHSFIFMYMYDSHTKLKLKLKL